MALIAADTCHLGQIFITVNSSKIRNNSELTLQFQGN
jgi:hypothetical protein